MRIIDEKLASNPWHYILQPVLGGTMVFMALMFLGMLEYPTLVAALGASAFVAYATPHAQAARPRCMIGGYMVGVACGFLCYSLLNAGWLVAVTGGGDHLRAFMGAVAVSLTIMGMTIVNVEHAPAVGIALGFCLHPWQLSNVFFIMGGVILMSVVRHLLRRSLINLI